MNSLPALGQFTDRYRRANISGMDDDVVVVDENDHEIGTMPESEAHQDGTRHRVVVTFVDNPMGEILVQVRMSGSLDHSSAGHVHPGESYADAAKRELAEELGIIEAELAKIGHGVSYERQSDGGAKTHVFDVFRCSGSPGRLQESEVRGVYWADPEVIQADMVSGASNAIYAGGFRVSLPIYLAWRKT